MKKPIQLLAISGSVRAASSNMAILKQLAPMLPAEVNYLFYTGLENLPHFNPDRDNHETIAPVNELRNLVRESDGIIICTPEYAFGVPGVLKNALDWMVSTDVFLRKPTAAITASSQGGNAHTSLLLTLKALTATVGENASLLISYIRTKVNASGEITDPVTRDALQKVTQALLQSIEEKNSA